MKSAWRNTSAVILSAVYLSVVSFGHHFHNHGVHGNERCARVAHDHAGSADPCHRRHTFGSGNPAASRSESSTLEDVSSGHFCAVCNFFSNHGTTVGGEDVVTTGRMVRRAVAAPRPVALEACPGPQQPRAPPLSV